MIYSRNVFFFLISCVLLAVLIYFVGAIVYLFTQMVFKGIYRKLDIFCDRLQKRVGIWLEMEDIDIERRGLEDYGKRY